MVWTPGLCSLLQVKYDGGRVCVCEKQKHVLMFRILLKNANNQKPIHINNNTNKSKIKKSYISGYEQSGLAFITLPGKKNHFFLYNSGLGSSLAG